MINPAHEGVIIGGAVEVVPGLLVKNYLGDTRLALRLGHSKRDRHTRWIRSLVLHNTKNIPCIIKAGFGTHQDVGFKVSKFWTTNPDPAGAHLVVDWDGAVTCHCDLLRDAAYHAGSMNEVSIGIEIFEDNHGVVYAGQLDAVSTLVRWLCHRFGIQMQMPEEGGILKRISMGGKNAVGIFGHVHQAGSAKGYDPSEAVFKYLRFSTDIRTFKYVDEEDLVFWKRMQQQLDLPTDGIPGPMTQDALQAQGFKNGIYDWVTPVHQTP